MKNDLKLLGYMLGKMHEYQRIHDVKDQCCTNVSYLYDILKYNTNLNVKVKSVYVLFNYDHENKGICTGHVCLEIDGVIIDPSYQYSKIKGATYTNSFKKVIKHLQNVDSVTKSQILNNNLHFTKIANQINSGECLISCKDYYHSQADYCQFQFKEV